MVGRGAGPIRGREPAQAATKWGRPTVAGRDTDSYFGRAIVDARPTFHLTYRLGIRLVQFVALGGAAGPGAGMWRAALPLFCLLDIGIWFALLRTERFGLLLRLAMDTIDIVFWSLSPLPVSGDFGIAVQIGVPLSVEAGFRIGIWAGVVPAVEAAATVIARVIAGKAPRPITFSPLVIGVVMGMALYAYCRHLYRQSEIERSLRLSADRRRAFLAGQNAVAMGASSVVDAIEGLVPVLGRPSPGSALWELADGWKSRLGHMTSREAAYLQVTLLEWARDHNRHPDLASRVELFFEEGIGTTLLTGTQVRWLRDDFDRRNMCGATWIALVGTASDLRNPGSVLALRVGSQEVVVPADAHRALRPLDGSVVGYLLVATFIPLMTLSTALFLPWSAAIATIGLSLGVGWWCHRRLMAYGPAARPTNVHCAVGLSLVLTTFFSVTMRHQSSVNGDPNVVSVGLQLLALIGGAYWRDSRRIRVELGLGMTATCVLAILLHRGPLHVRDVVMMLDWGLLLFFPVWQHIGRSLDRAQIAFAAEAEHADANTVVDAFRDGREDVLALVRRACEDAEHQLVAVTAQLAAPDADLATARLKEVSLRLNVIAGSG